MGFGLGVMKAERRQTYGWGAPIFGVDDAR